MENPIKDNRIISSHTYAVRNLQFLQSCYPDAGSAHPMSEEEYEYLCIVAVDLLLYQFETCPDEEKWYFNNLVKDCKSGKELISKWYKPEFVKFLKAIKAL